MSNKKKLLLFGGTFNPVHNGHKKLLEDICNELCFDKIVIMPTKIPPHKQAFSLADGSDRLNMLKIAFADFKNIEFSDFELINSGKSYTYYTLKYLRERYEDYKIYLAVGSDMLLTFDEWFCFEEILKMAALICVSREDGDFCQLENKAAELAAFGEILLVKTTPFEISSTKIREMIKNNEDSSCYLDKNVVKYIIDNNLYK